MNDHSFAKTNLQRIIAVVLGIGINVGFYLLSHYLDLPIYLDTIGTIAVSALSGVLFGVITAASTHLICTLFNPISVYFTSVSVFISLVTVAYVRYPRNKRKRFIPLYLALLAVIGGGVGTGINWILTGGPYVDDVADVARMVASEGTALYVVMCVLISIGLDIVSKTISVVIVYGIMHIIPEDVRTHIWNSVWMQKPLTSEEQMEMNKKSKTRRMRLGTRILLLLTMTGVLLITIQSLISMKLYEDTVNAEYASTAMKAAQFVAESVDADRVEDYLSSGQTVDECDRIRYQDTMTILDRAVKTINGIKYLYVYRVEGDGIRLIFDTDPEGRRSDIIGDLYEFDESFSKYKKELLAGEQVPVVESEDEYGHLQTAYYPIHDSTGKCVAYAGADVYYTEMVDYTKVYAVRLMIILLGYFMLILACGLWITRYYMVRPINTITSAMDDFAVEEVDQTTLDDMVRDFRNIRVRTGDELEYLYDALCRVMTSVAEQMRDLRHYTEATAQMQNGLIITMADMVESRDSDTGAHVQKTAAYVDIILKGLKKKGYYAEKLTPKYMSDVVMSAPLHDVGKINVPDYVLNKPGKLTDEEYDIIKTHTTEGRILIEKAIDTVHGENYLKEARNMAGYHHERWDGKGYPEGLHGEVIPLSARIMAVADVFDALASRRVYKPPFPPEKALEIIEEGSGTQFDPKCVEVFLDSVDEVMEVLKKFNEE